MSLQSLAARGSLYDSRASTTSDGRDVGQFGESVAGKDVSYESMQVLVTRSARERCTLWKSGTSARTTSGMRSVRQLAEALRTRKVGNEGAQALRAARRDERRSGGRWGEHGVIVLRRAELWEGGGYWVKEGQVSAWAAAGTSDTLRKSESYCSLGRRLMRRSRMRY